MLIRLAPLAGARPLSRRRDGPLASLPMLELSVLAATCIVLALA
jgi:hypothetical protein